MNGKSEIAENFANEHNLIRLYEFNDPKEYDHPHWAYAQPFAIFGNGACIVIAKTAEKCLEEMRTVRLMTEGEVTKWTSPTQSE